MKVYSYCICADLDSFGKSVTGVSGAAVRILRVDDLSVLVSDCEGVLASRENALAHAAVVRSVLDQTTPMPFRFGTISTEQQLRSYLTTNKLALANKLAHLRGCVQIDLKLIWQRQGLNLVTSDQPAAGPGTAFLRKKRRELLGDEPASAQRDEVSRLLRDGLGAEIRDECMELHPSETGLLARVFHLVEKPKIRQYREKIGILVSKRPELQVSVSGPWPPYSFANIELEFKSHFGVS